MFKQQKNIQMKWLDKIDSDNAKKIEEADEVLNTEDIQVAALKIGMRCDRL